MPPAVANLKSRLAAADRRHAAGVALFAAVQLAAFVVLLWSEAEPAARAAFILAWGVLNFFWLVLLRRPLTSAALSLTLVVVLVMLSQFKHSVLMMTATFVDVMVIDIATLLFFIRVNPRLAHEAGACDRGGASPSRSPVWPLGTSTADCRTR